MEVEVINRRANAREAFALNYKLGNEFTLGTPNATVHHVLEFTESHFMAPP